MLRDIYSVLFHFENRLMQTSVSSISINLYLVRDLSSSECSVLTYWVVAVGVDIRNVFKADRNGIL